jgi:hypothetical protein
MKLAVGNDERAHPIGFAVEILGRRYGRQSHA